MKKFSRLAAVLVFVASFGMPLLALAGSVPAGGTAADPSECASGVMSGGYCVGNGAAGTVNTTYLNFYYYLVLQIVNSYLIPVLFAVAFIVFLFGVYKYFIQGAASDEDRKSGRQFVLWGIIGFVIITTVWGLVNIVKDTIVPTSASQNHPNYPKL